MTGFNGNKDTIYLEKSKQLPTAVVEGFDYIFGKGSWVNRNLNRLRNI